MALSRRRLFEAGAVTLTATAFAPGASSAQARTSADSRNEMIVRKWFRLWETEKTNWSAFEAFLADDFTFTSATPDDHISRAAFKTTCWDTQINHIKQFDLERMMAKGDFVFVRYLCHTGNGTTFRNVELHELRGAKIKSIECYFGGAGYPTAAEAKKS